MASNHAQPNAVSNPRAASPSNVDDGLLKQRFRAGDAAAFAALMRRHQRALCGLIVRLGVSDADRDDALQAILVRVFRAAPTFDPARPFKPWLFTIAANQVRSHLRSPQSRADRMGTRESAGEVVDPGAVARHTADTHGPHGTLEQRELADFIDGEIKRLPEAVRTVVVLICIEELSGAEVAAALDIPEGTVKTHLHRGRLRIARALARREALVRREVGS